MPQFTDSLRGYAFLVNERDQFRCVYCGLDGSRSFEAWLSLSWDHLLPEGDSLRDDQEFIVTACMFCNVADNQYFAKAAERGLSFTSKTPEQLVDQRRPFVMTTRSAYREFWDAKVRFRDQGKLREPPYSKVQGQYLAFIADYTEMNGRPPAEADMQWYFSVTPPSVHNMILTLERRGLIRRTPGRARSIEVLLPRDQIPWLGGA